MLLIGIGVGLQGAVGNRASQYTPEHWHTVIALGWIVVVLSVPVVVSGVVYLAGTRNTKPSSSAPQTTGSMWMLKRPPTDGHMGLPHRGWTQDDDLQLLVAALDRS